ERRKNRAAEEITALLTDVLTATVTLPLRDRDADEATRERGRKELREIIRRRERAARRTVQDIYHHSGLEAQETAASHLADDVFSEQSFSIFGLSTVQLAMTGAASGAVAGSVIDVALGGASLLLGAGIGAALGAAGMMAGAGRLAKVQVLGQSLGGYDLRVGPPSDPNLPWVLLGRALAHVRLIAERNHARREALVLDVDAGRHLADSIEPARRRRLDTLFRRLREERGIGAAERERLVAGIAASIDTP